MQASAEFEPPGLRKDPIRREIPLKFIAHAVQLRFDTDRELLLRLATRAGGERIEADELPQP